MARVLSYGIDTSVLVRLVVREPQRDYERCISRLRELVELERREIFASNQVIGEAHVTLTHHYNVTDREARTGLINALTSGLVTPLSGRAVLDILEASGGPGLFDRLITDDYTRSGLETLTLDRRMATLPSAGLI